MVRTLTEDLDNLEERINEEARVESLEDIQAEQDYEEGDENYALEGEGAFADLFDDPDADDCEDEDYEADEDDEDY